MCDVSNWTDFSEDLVVKEIIPSVTPLVEEKKRIQTFYTKKQQHQTWPNG